MIVAAQPLEIVERKVCEGFGCGAPFYRAVPVHVKEGETICPACRERELRLARIALAQSRQTRVYRKAS